VKIIDIPLVVRSLAEVYGPLTDEAGDQRQQLAPTAPQLLAAMVLGVLEVHQHDLYRWDRDRDGGQAVPVDDLQTAEFAVCVSCGTIEREYFWCWTVRQLYVALVSTDETTPEAWQGWQDMAEAINRARAAYPPSVASAVIRSLNNPAYTVASRTNLLDTILACTPAVPAQVVSAERGPK